MFPADEIDRRHYDSAWVIASYNLDGTFKKWLAKYPDEVAEYSLASNHLGSMYPKVAVMPNGDIIYGFVLLSKIFNLESGKEIAFELPGNNLKYLENYQRLAKSQHGKISGTQLDSLLQWRPYWLRGLASNDRGEIVSISTVRISQHPFCTDQWLQWYRPSGELLAETRIPYDSSHGKIYLTQYLPSLNQIAVVTSDKNGWYLSRYTPVENAINK